MIKIDRAKSLDSIVSSGGNLLEERLRLEELVTEILKKLVKNVPDQVDKNVVAALNTIRNFFRADCCCLLEVVPDSRRIRVLNIGCGKKPQKDVAGMDIVAMYPKAHDRAAVQGEPILLLPPADVPPVEDARGSGWERWKTRTLCMLPLRIDGGIQAFSIGESFIAGDSAFRFSPL